MLRIIKMTIFFLIPILAKSQVNLHYYNNEILQSNYLNPANTPSCKVNIGIPVLNGISANLAHNGFTYNQLFKQNADNTLSPDLDNVLKKIGSMNYVSANLDLSLFFVGIKHRDYYFNFSVRERILTDVFYNNKLLQLAINGNNGFQGQTASLKGTGLNMNYFRQFSFGVSKQNNEYFTYGAHLNLLFGKLNAVLQLANTSITTEETTFILNAETNARFKSSLPFIISNDDVFAGNNAEINPLNLLMNRKNKGLSIDAGFKYNYNGDTWIYGSILDFGFIRYKSNATKIQANGEFTYTGPSLDQQDLGAYYAELANSLSDSIATYSYDPYFYALPSRIYLGLNKVHSKKLSYGILANSTFYRYKIKILTGLHGSYQLGKHINTMLSWSYANRSFTNVGGGLSFFFNPFNFYIVSDNIPGIIWPRSTKSLNLQFGFNLRFGCKTKKENEGGCGCSWTEYPKSYQSRIK